MLFANTTSLAGKWTSANLPLGSELVRSEIVTEVDGSRTEVSTYTNPFKGTFQLRNPLDPNKRPILVPVNPLQTIQGGAVRESSGDVFSILTRDAGQRSESTTDRRAVPRPDRDPRAPVVKEDGSVSTSADRRTGGPFASFLSELKGFFLRPAGVVVFGVLFFAVGAAIYRRSKKS